MNARRFASIAGTVAVTTIAAVASYDHMRVLAEQAGQPPLLAALLPLSVDGMVLVATLALGDGRRSRWSAWLAFVLGVAASLAANVMVAAPDPVARLVSAWPAVALLLTVEVLARSGRLAPATVTASATPRADMAVPTLSATPSDAPAQAMPAVRPVSMADGPTAAPAASVARKRPAVAEVPGVAGRADRPANATAARVAALLADRPKLTGADVAAAVGVSDRTARRYLTAARSAMAASV
ncbi:DUF2637 domain-containing protein [Planosporangium flavigriseum]|uniref:DUF2637 domain-containing protein n=1 Tax=Planosporangium flavigriseum TaxID=373681 RepID=A0A8J3PN89_9ACTN|nr:DUF2637 domain-containing protein [Planosporangium flavigriseum]NJC66474.1 DUF2637 domain-containing protein [Planosporangium flavigriseum]GIG76351.1 hypothetical protein Pfl04_47550 [Planosporangium flavigriseum]